MGPEIVGVTRRSPGEVDPPAAIRLRMLLNSPVPAAMTDPPTMGCGEDGEGLDGF